MTALLEVDQFSVHFPIKSGIFAPPVNLRAVEAVSLSIAEGETLALVGESGSGKSTIGSGLAGRSS